MILTGLTIPLQQVVRSAPADTGAVVRTPLPGGVGTFVRSVLNAPAWLQIAVIVIGVLTFLGLFMWAWFNIEEIAHWFATRSRGWKLAFVAIVLSVASGAVWFGNVAWAYTQHNNDFCIGCHVMG